MKPPMLSICWIYLDNLAHGWFAGVNLTKEDLRKSAEWAVSENLVLGGRLTDYGRGYYLSRYHEKTVDEEKK